jgi:hypothetical protein
MYYFMVLAEQALFAMIYFWFVTLPIVVGVIIAVAYTLKQEPGLIDAKAIGGLAVLFVFPVLILSLGVQHEAPEQNKHWQKDPRAEAGQSQLNTVIIMQLVVGLFLTWWLRRCVWVVLTIFLLSLEMSMAATFISSMAIRGVWL